MDIVTNACGFVLCGQVVAILLLSCGVFYGLSVQELPAHLQRTVLVLYSAQLGVTTALFLAVSVYCHQLTARY